MIHGLVLPKFERPDTKAQTAVMDIMEKAFDPAFGEAWTASQLAGMMVMHGTWLTLARLDAATLGFALVRSILDEAELLLLAVDPGWRGRGIGAALVNECLSNARGMGIKSMHLEVRSTNNAIQLYSKMGFTHVHTRHNYYRGISGTLHDALSFRLDL